MAPKHIENQTLCIIRCLFEEEDAHGRGMVVPDGDVGDGVQELREPQPLPKWQSPKIQIGEPILVTPISYAREKQGLVYPQRPVYQQGPPKLQSQGFPKTVVKHFNVVEPSVMHFRGGTDLFTEDPFDPVLIADKLRELGDDYDEKVIQPLINNVRQAAADQVVQAFGDSVDGLCRSWVGQGAEVVSEMQLLKASVTLGLYVKDRCPDLVSTVQSAMGAFVNTRLGSWVEQQGGWDEVASN